MGAGGLSGELRDHSNHVDAIFRSHFPVTGQRSSAASSTSDGFLSTSYAFSIPGEISEDMPCTDCRANFSFFRKKNLCRKCKRCYCTECFTRDPKFVDEENSRHCLSCRALHFPLAYKEHLINLKVKDLQEYLRLQGVPMNHCKEKTDLVDLIVRHVGQRGTTRNTGWQAQQSRTQQPQGSVVQQPRPHSFHTFWSNQGRTLPSQLQPHQSHPRQSQPTQVHQPSTTSPSRKSLSDIQSIEDIQGLSVKELKCILNANFVDFRGCCEKEELLQRVRTLWTSKQNGKGSSSADNGNDWDDQCKICMDAGIDCVLLECGHMVTCTQCGKQINDCPICRQHISRIVHVFKA